MNYTSGFVPHGSKELGFCTHTLQAHVGTFGGHREPRAPQSLLNLCMSEAAPVPEENQVRLQAKHRAPRRAGRGAIEW